MLCAAIDVGSNTVRMLLAGTGLASPRYFRQVTRLAGESHPEAGLSPQSMERTLKALDHFAHILKQQQIKDIRVVGTAALRNASNSAIFIEQVLRRTGLDIKVIDGDIEADLSCRGILSVLDPPPGRALLFDIGGGSTEVILFASGKQYLQKSLPLGVVHLSETCLDQTQRHEVIQRELSSLATDPVWQQWQHEDVPIELVGTAGTVTTLAALNLKMTDYVGHRVNNLVLERSWLHEMTVTLDRMSLEQRLMLPGMEEGRGDLIVPGLQIISALLDLSSSESLRVADAGLLEGLLLRAIPPQSMSYPL